MEADFLEHPVLFPGRITALLLFLLMGCTASEDRVVEFYPQSRDTMEIRTYHKGLEHGTWKKFYPGGIVRELRYFENGQKTGDLITWWENGQKQSHYLFKNGEYEGTCREWNMEGKLVREMNYHKGYEEGSQKQWYDDGNIRSNYVIIKGRRFGLLGTKNCTNVSDSLDMR